ncbi:MAG: class I SAM-dependent methyltransferase [Flavobacteriales bacterium TMED235]|nr:MAG: class I SAM-dependent methyltransferase [Flavobacteriales bacterium TMED235]|tara:strand:+ start:43 stop:942 length:900 start_codon:yes stop_codon:yes gene_type:complete
MSFLKKKALQKNNIFKFELIDNSTKKVSNFYRETPFPNYKSNDNKSTILEKGNKNYLSSKFKNFIGHDKDVLEVGCGTGQLAIYFALATNNRVVGLDPTIESIELAANFSNKHNIDNIKFINADIFDDVLEDKFFDFIWCNGVLHHTKNPYEAFTILIKSLKVKGYVLIGLYNKIGRIRTILRKYMFKIFGIRFLNIFDPTLRNLKNSDEEKKAWIRDQYMHPLETLHTIDEVIDWFSKNNIEFINSIPSSNFEESDNDLFVKKSKGTVYSRFVNQFSMIFNSLGSDGGLFIVIGKKNE